jgi:outer membrane protein
MNGTPIVKTRTCVIVGIACAVGLGSAHAEAQGLWTARIGYAHAAFSPAATLDLAGNPVPGAELKVANKWLLIGELGYEFADRWTARVAFAPPPTITVTAGGSLTNFVPPLSGTVGTVKIAPVVLTATYSPGDFHGVAPYVGAGVNYTRVVSTSDGDVASIEAKNAWGAALQAGFEVPVDRNWSVYADARKLYVKSTGSGVIPALGGLPVRADVALDPLIVSAGIQYRF